MKKHEREARTQVLYVRSKFQQQLFTFGFHREKKHYWPSQMQAPPPTERLTRGGRALALKLQTFAESGIYNHDFVPYTAAGSYHLASSPSLLIYVHLERLFRVNPGSNVLRRRRGTSPNSQRGATAWWTVIHPRHTHTGTLTHHHGHRNVRRWNEPLDRIPQSCLGTGDFSAQSMWQRQLLGLDRPKSPQQSERHK